jgi:radical SAM superfamily enzyme YgiQ (UPF0313 family)
MKILLVSPTNPNDVDHEILRELPFLDNEAFFAPHGCAVVAALTPSEHEVQIFDETIHGPVDDLLDRETFDIVGMSLVANAFERSIAIAERFRNRGRPGLLVAGGACMLHMVTRLRDLIDVAFIGEAEETWPQFIRDYAKGRRKNIYRQIAKPDLSGMPVPRWELIRGDLSRYSMAAVQTIRGCPHDCSFCDVIYTFGRKLRKKPVDQVIEEIKLLQSLGVEMIFFSDDNFAADRKHAKAMLRRIIEINKTFEVQVGFVTQVDITIAKDDELLQLMLDANFIDLQIGIESVHPESLKDIHKQHNLNVDLVESVKKIQSYGMIVLAHMIVGIDSDDDHAFERSEQFLKDANIVHQANHPLMAPPGTKLWYQLRREGRLVEVSPDLQDRMDVYTNVVPKQMSRLDLIGGLAEYRLRVSEPERFLHRLRGFVDGVRHKPSFEAKNTRSLWSRRKALTSMLRYYSLRATKSERRVFFTLIKENGRRHADLMPQIMYAMICHTMERRHAELKEPWAAQIVEQERNLPGGPQIMSRRVVIAPLIRQHFRKIVNTAYGHICEKVTDRNTLCEVMVEALCDYSLSFGETFETFDGYQRDAVRKSVDRVVNRLPDHHVASDAQSVASAPPPGFTREILDALDQTLRFGLAS